jgi:hypothetical protein
MLTTNDTVISVRTQKASIFSRKVIFASDYMHTLEQRLYETRVFVTEKNNYLRC